MVPTWAAVAPRAAVTAATVTLGHGDDLKMLEGLLKVRYLATW